MKRAITLSLLLLTAGATGARAHEGHEHASGDAGRGQMPGMNMPLDQPAVQPPRPPQSELTVLAHHLTQPEYLHVVLNPLPPVGMGLGAAFLILGLWLGSDGIREAGLLLVALGGAIVFPVLKLGQHAYDRIYENIPLEAQQWLDVHMHRAESTQWLFYLTAALALWAFIGSRKENPAAARQAQAALIATILCAAVAGWISHAGGQVRHSEFRMGPPVHNAKPMQESSRPGMPK